MLEALIKNAKKIGLAAVASAFLFTSDADAQTKYVEYKSKNTPGLAQGVKKEKPVEKKKEAEEPYRILPITLEAYDATGNKVAECIEVKINDTCEVPEGSTIKLIKPTYATKKGSPPLLIDFTFKQNGKAVINPNYDSNDKTRSEFAILSPFNLDTLQMQGEYKGLALAEVGPKPEHVKASYPFNLLVYDPDNRTASTYNPKIATTIDSKSLKKAMEDKNSKGKNNSGKNQNKNDKQNNNKNKQNKNSGNQSNNSSGRNSGNSSEGSQSSNSTFQVRFGAAFPSSTYNVSGDPNRAGMGIVAGARAITDNFFANAYVNATKYDVTNPETGKIMPQQTESIALLAAELKLKGPLAIYGKISQNNLSDFDSSSESKFLSGGIGARFNIKNGFVSATYGKVRVVQNQQEGNRNYSDILNGNEITGKISKSFGRSAIYAGFSEVQANSAIKETKSTTIEGDFSYKPFKTKDLGIFVGLKNTTYTGVPLKNSIVTTELNDTRAMIGITYSLSKKEVTKAN